MPRLNKTIIDKIESPQAAPGKQAQTFYRDSALPGFGLRVTNTGVKAFIVEKRIKGKVKRITIGKYGILTAEKARIKAIDLLSEITVGRDPVAEKKAISFFFGSSLSSEKNSSLVSKKVSSTNIS